MSSAQKFRESRQSRRQSSHRKKEIRCSYRAQLLALSRQQKAGYVFSSCFPPKRRERRVAFLFKSRPPVCINSEPAPSPGNAVQSRARMERPVERRRPSLRLHFRRGCLAASTARCRPPVPRARLRRGWMLAHRRPGRSSHQCSATAADPGKGLRAPNLIRSWISASVAPHGSGLDPTHRP